MTSYLNIALCFLLQGVCAFACGYVLGKRSKARTADPGQFGRTYSAKSPVSRWRMDDY